jgi:hypothetical protein
MEDHQKRCAAVKITGTEYAFDDIVLEHGGIPIEDFPLKFPMLKNRRHPAEYMMVSYPPRQMRRIEFGAVSVSAFAFEIASIEFQSGTPHGTLTITGNVPDRSDGTPIQVRLARQVDSVDWASDSGRARMLRNAIAEYLLHELDEHIYVDGRREFEPHLREKAR